MGLTIWTTAFAQRDWRTDALVQRLPSGQAYLEIQTAWESDLASAGDSVTLTVVVTRQDDVLGFRNHGFWFGPTCETHLHFRICTWIEFLCQMALAPWNGLMLRDDEELHSQV